MRVLFISAVVLACAGCSPPRQIMDRDDYLVEATRKYPVAERERVIRAAEIVLKQSDPADWDFRYTTEGFTGLRHYVIYAVLAAANGREKWEFNTELVDPKTVKASVAVSEAGVASGGYSVTAYEGKIAFVPLYRLFWVRVDYVLGRTNHWVTCKEALEEVNARKENHLVLGGLCGATSQGKDAEPPDQLASKASG